MVESKPGQSFGLLLPVGTTLMLIGLALAGWLAVIGDISVFVAGALLAFSGMTIAACALFRARGPLYWLNLYRGCLYCVIGCMFMSKPVESQAAMGLLASALLLVEGVFEIAPSLLFGFASRVARTVVGSISIVAGLLIWMAWPQSGNWLVFACLATDITLTGSSLIVTSLTERKSDSFAWYSLMGEVRSDESSTCDAFLDNGTPLAPRESLEREKDAA